MKIDGRTYRGIAEAIESAFQNPAQTVASGGRPTLDHTPTPLEKRLGEVNAANEKFLSSYRDDIRMLVAVVRNPANLPK
jgi:hypothetical protein